MKMRFLIICLIALATFSLSANAEETITEFNPFDANVEEQLREMDEAYEAETGLPAILEGGALTTMTDIASGCRRASCAVYARVSKAEQRMYLSLNGRVIGVYPTSTGMPGYSTPDFDTRPDGRIYNFYSSKKWPGGDYNGLGNMPYAVFIRGGFAIHGTPKGNWPKLGQRASHGCIRVHPDAGRLFNRLVREYGIRQTWITVH
jgi:hypothetical protein